MAKTNAINNRTDYLFIVPTASTDGFIQFTINSVDEFRIGVDVNDSNAFKISLGSDLGTNDVFKMTTTGINTLPFQPAFLAVLNTTIPNASGNAVPYTVAWDTEVFDQNNNFSATTFTAPVTGKYRLETSILLNALDVANINAILQISTSNRSYLTQANPGASMDANTQFSYYASVLADMDAGDTCTVIVTVSGGTQIINLIGSGATTPSCWFSGNLEV